jgi:membrane protein DedA with SNARE-associated domain
VAEGDTSRPNPELTPHIRNEWSMGTIAEGWTSVLPPVVSAAVAQGISLLGHHAAGTALAAAALESLPGVGFLFPGGTVVILSAYAARSSGGADAAGVVLAAWLGMTLGAALDYLIGRAIGRRVVPRRAPFRLAARWRRVQWGARKFLARWGWWAILVANLAGPGRSSVALAAGASGWSFASFLAGQALAAAAWSALYCGLGFFVAGSAAGVEALAGTLGAAAAALVLGLVGAPALARVTVWLVRRVGRGAAAPARAGALWAGWPARLTPPDSLRAPRNGGHRT